MSASFFFYDLETTGVRSRECRIMQFAGQRTDMDLKAVGEPFNIMIKLAPDVLPDPEAVLLTGITPQMTIADGITEAEFLKIFEAEIATPDTIFVGYNTVRFDDEFMRCLHYRNFYDPYEWHWKDGRGRWDLLDLVRMTRALRPDGIEWPFTEEGVPTNRLELITKLNGLDHAHAHDALNDVLASIALAQLIRDKQPKLFDWLFRLRDKKAVKQFLDKNHTFVYSSGKYANEYQKTAVVELLELGDDRHGATVFDLLHDPRPFAKLTPAELVERWRYNRDVSAPPRLPVKTLKYNNCPAICPTGLIADSAIQERLGVTLELINTNRAYLHALPELKQNILKARDMMDDERESTRAGETVDADDQVHGGFLDDHDKSLERAVRASEPDELGRFADSFHDARMRTLLPRYKARNYPDSLTSEERQEWETYRSDKLFAGGDDSLLAKYFKHLGECAELPQYKDKQFLLEELQLYGQSIMPAELGD
jgi:exodeoxyribonuclease-1